MLFVCLSLVFVCLSLVFLVVGAGLTTLNVIRWLGLELRYQVIAGLVAGVVVASGVVMVAWLSDAPLLVPLLGGGSMLAAFGVRRLARHQRTGWWQTTADRLNLDGDGQGLSGRVGAVEVEARDLTSAKPNPVSEFVCAWISVKADGWPGGVTAHAGTLGRRQLSRGLGTGDEAFDRTVRVEGEQRRLCAVFDHEVRALAAKASLLPTMVLNDEGVSFTRGAWFTNRADVARAIDLGTALMNALMGQPQSIPERLLTHLQPEPLPEVRRRLLQCLLEEDEPWREQALELALQDDDARVQGLAMVARADATPEAFQGRVALASPEGGDLSMPSASGEVGVVESVRPR